MKIPTHVSEENPVITRITNLLLKNGKSQKELERYLGLGKGVYTDWKSGHSSSYRQRIDEIARFFNVSPTYLLRGEEDISADQEILMDLFHKMTDDQRKMTLEYASQLVTTT